MNFDDELHQKPISAPPEREISLGTGTILGIFLLLALICGAFFGFGYTMGHRAPPAASLPEANTVAKSDKTGSAFSNFKAAPVPTGKVAPQPASGEASAADIPASESAPGPPDTPEGGAVVEPPIAADGTWMVQVSATTRQLDAEALTRMLVGKGFTAAIAQDQDLKFHVRVGPFASKKDADTARKLLVASGYKDPFLTPR